MSVAIYLMYLGLTLLALLLDRHYKEVVGKERSKYFNILAKVYGTAFLIISLIMMISISGLSLGFTYWVGYLGLCIIFIALVFAYRPRFIVALSILLLMALFIL